MTQQPTPAGRVQLSVKLEKKAADSTNVTTLMRTNIFATLNPPSVKLDRKGADMIATTKRTRQRNVLSSMKQDGMIFYAERIKRVVTMEMAERSVATNRPK